MSERRSILFLYGDGANDTQPVTTPIPLISTRKTVRPFGRTVFVLIVRRVNNALPLFGAPGKRSFLGKGGTAE